MKKRWDAYLEWTPTLYDGIETAALSKDDGSGFLARWSVGILRWVTTSGDKREDAVRELIEMAPDIMEYLASEEGRLREIIYRLDGDPSDGSRSWKADGK